MASHDPDKTLVRQYVELTKTSPRQMAGQIKGQAPDTAQAKEQSASETAEAEWSLRRIERRVGSIA